MVGRGRRRRARISSCCCLCCWGAFGRPFVVFVVFVFDFVLRARGYFSRARVSFVDVMSFSAYALSGL